MENRKIAIGLLKSPSQQPSPLPPPIWLDQNKVEVEPSMFRLIHILSCPSCPPSFISPLRIDTHLHTNESKQQNGIVSFSSTAEFPFKADNHSIISYCVEHIEFISLIIMYCISTEMIITLSMVSLCHARVWHEIIFAEANKENRTTTTTTAAAGKERKKHTYTLKCWIETKIALMHPNFILVSFKIRIKK